MRPGDLLLVRTKGLAGKLVRFGQRIVYRDPQAAYYNHVGVIVDEHNLIEALPIGVARSPLSKYDGFETLVLPAALDDPAMTANAIRFAESCVGEEYDWGTIISIALGRITGGKLSFGFDSHQICSGLASRACERYGYIFPRDPARMTPADLKIFFAK